MLQKSIIIIRHTLPLWQTHFSKLHFYPDCIQILDIIPKKQVEHQLSLIELLLETKTCKYQN